MKFGTAHLVFYLYMLFRCNSKFWYVAQVGRMEVQSDQFRAALMDLLASPQVAVSSCEIY